MKRKFKLITSIASLTAAIALLAFGAYAAGTRNVNVTGTVTFAATLVDAEVSVYEDAALAVTGGSDPIAYAQVGTTFVFSATVGDTNNANGQTFDLQTNQLNDSTLLVYSYRIDVENTFADRSITATFSWPMAGEPLAPDVPAANGLSIVYGWTTPVAEPVTLVQTVVAGATNSFFVTVTVTDPAVIPAALALDIAGNVTLATA